MEAKDFVNSEWNGWCTPCKSYEHEDCTYDKREPYYSRCSCPCAEKLTHSERFALRKFLLTLDKVTP